MESVIKMTLDSNWDDLNSYVEKRAADKILDKIDLKKQEIVDKLNANMTNSRKSKR